MKSTMTGSRQNILTAVNRTTIGTTVDPGRVDATSKDAMTCSVRTWTHENEWTNFNLSADSTSLRPWSRGEASISTACRTIQHRGERRADVVRARRQTIHSDRGEKGKDGKRPRLFVALVVDSSTCLRCEQTGHWA